LSGELLEFFPYKGNIEEVYFSPPSPLTASLFITIRAFRCYGPYRFGYSIHDSTEVAIQKMIEASQRMIDVNSQVPGEAREGWGINPAVKRHLELEIKRLFKMHLEMQTS
jgi:hypothetical protein